jgi:hypothetical protein
MLGGDALIGRRLFRLFRAAGFSRIELSLQPEVHWSGSAGFVAWIDNLLGNVQGGRNGLIKSGLCTADEIDQAIAELSAVRARNDASLNFAWNRAAARL